MVNSLSDFDRQVLDKMCQKIIDERPSPLQSSEDVSIIFLKDVCLDLIKNRFNDYYDYVNAKPVTSEETSEMVRIVKSKIDESFEARFSKIQ